MQLNPGTATDNSTIKRAPVRGVEDSVTGTRPLFDYTDTLLIAPVPLTVLIAVVRADL